MAAAAAAEAGLPTFAPGLISLVNTPPLSRSNFLRALHHLRPDAFAFPGNPLLPSPALAEILGVWSLCDAVEAMDAQALAHWRSAQMAFLVDHLRRVSPIWAERLSAWDGTLQSLPVLTRAAVVAQVREEGALAVPVGHGAVGEYSTSGSTGVPLRMHRSAWSEFLSGLLFQRHAQEAGVDFSVPLVTIRGRSAAPNHTSWGGVASTLFVTGPSEGLTARGTDPAEVLARVREQRGAVLASTTAMLRLILQTAEAEGRADALGCVSSILTLGSQVLDEDRRLARGIFGSRIIDRYSTEEAGPIALQCVEHEDFYHVTTPNVIVETLRVDGTQADEGEDGRVVVTSLHAFATPFIRYEPGDMAKLHAGCPCGFRGGAISDILGRAGEVLVYPNGARRWMALRARDLLAIAPVREFRLTRRAALEFELQVRLRQGRLSDEQREGLGRAVLAMSVPDAAVRVIERDEIDWEGDAKLTAFVDLTRNRHDGRSHPAREDPQCS